MKEQEQRSRNRKIGLILGLLFLSMFAITMLGFVLGLDAPPVIKTIVSVIATIIAGIIGISLIGAAFYEMIIQYIVDRFKRRGASRVSK